MSYLPAGTVYGTLLDDRFFADGGDTFHVDYGALGSITFWFI